MFTKRFSEGVAYIILCLVFLSVHPLEERPI